MNGTLHSRLTGVSRGDGIIGTKAMSARQPEKALSRRFIGVGHADGLTTTKTCGSRQPTRALSGQFIRVSRGDGIIFIRAMSARQRGFTLIEILLAMTILVAGLALGFATLRAATATASRGEAMAERSERVRAVEGFLRRRLSSALPLAFATEEQTGRAIRFVGEPQRLQFVADLPDYLGRGGPHLHDIEVVRGDGVERLQVSFLTVVAGEAVVERDARPPEPLAEDVIAMRFRYRGLDERRQLTEWLDRWEYGDALPLQVSIEIETASAGRWPAMVVMLPQGGAATITTVAQ